MESDNGFFGRFGGKYVAEVLRRPLDELEAAFKKYMQDKDFLSELDEIHDELSEIKGSLEDKTLGSLLLAVEDLAYQVEELNRILGDKGNDNT